MLHIPGLYIAHSDQRGRGVFTAQEITPGDLIEICPLLIIPKKDVASIHQTVIHDYYFLLEQPKGAACIALGYGSIYNHSKNPNAKVIFDYKKEESEIQCYKLIQPGTEIFIDYTDGGKEEAPLWFEAK
ncbi:MAG: SET domain-containing protein-lysine N-methyltransferase [Bacteroidota bacterium]